MPRGTANMVSKRDVIPFLISNHLYLLAVVFSRLDDSSVNDLISSIILRDDLFNISNEGIQRLILFEKEKHQYLNALLNKNIYRDDKYMTNIRMINFKFIVAGLGMFFALVWFTLFMFIEVPPENAKFIDAGIGMLTSLVGCTIYGYFRDNKNSKE